jgi:hypothetical protein
MAKIGGKWRNLRIMSGWGHCLNRGSDRVVTPRPRAPRRGGFGLAFAAGLALAVGAAPALAKTRALVVGVSMYPAEMVGDLQLVGPKNDAALMIETLRTMGLADDEMTVLADHLGETWIDRAADGEPTKQAIMDELGRLAADLGAGDTAIVYLSGHGSQSPELAAESKTSPEADGLDEIFLPIDIGKWSDAVGTVENSLVDDELGEAVRAIRARGATVWLIVDACHSGTLTRGAAGGEEGDQVRKVEPTALGIPAEAIAAAEARAPKLRSGGGGPAKAETAVEGAGAAGPGEGGYVAFYAAHPDQLALQRNLPKAFSKTVEKRPHGVLTFALASAIRSGRAATYRDLAFAVLSGYQGWGAQAPVPLFEGDLAEPLLGREATGPRRYAVDVSGDRPAIEGGAVDGIAVGAVYALSRADDAEGKVQGYVRVTEVGTAASTVEPVARDGVEAPDIARLAKARLIVATLVEPAVAFTFTVARPDPASATDKAGDNVVAALDAIATGPGDTGIAFAFVDAGNPADLGLFMSDGRLWLSPGGDPPVTEGRDRTPSVPLAAFADPSKAGPRVTQVLTSLAKARNLIRIADTIDDEAVRSALTIDASLFRPELGAPAADAKAPDDIDCPDYPKDRIADGAVPFAEIAASGLDAPDLGHCDVVYFEIGNRGEKPIDVTPLYVDGAGGIAYMGPGEGLRLMPGDKPQIVPVRIVTWSRKAKAPLPIGFERLLFFAVVQEGRDAVPADFRYLAQSDATKVASRGMGGSPLSALLDSAAFGIGGTKRSASVGGIGEAGVVQFRWRVRAPGEGQ